MSDEWPRRGAFTHDSSLITHHSDMTDPVRRALLYHFCRMQTPAVALPPAAFDRHLDRTFALFRRKNSGVTFPSYLDSLYSLDWYLCCGCLEGDGRAWEALFA